MAIERLHKRFAGQVVLDEASFELREGEIVLLRGPNGSGKTTLLNILTGNLEPDAGTIRIIGQGVSEAFRFPRHWWQNLNPLDHFTPERIAQEGVGRTWQDIRLFLSHDLRDNVAVAMPGQIGENPLAVLFARGKVRRQESRLRREADALLAGFGLGGRETSAADRVSLGQSKRVAIARAIKAGARILFLDEPLAALDAKGIRDVLSLLAEMAAKHRVTMVIVEHVFNIPKVLDLATTVWTLREGKIVVETPDEVRREARIRPEGQIEEWLARVGGGVSAVSHQALPSGARLSVVRPPGIDAGAEVLAVDNLIVRRGKRPVVGWPTQDGGIEGLSFSIAGGSLAILQAPNGWGKTTLLDALAGSIPVTSGSINLNGSSVQRMPTWARVGRGLCVLQSRDNVFPNLSVDEALALAGVTIPGESVQPFLGRPVSALSGGQKQKVAIECALARQDATLLLLDEPFGMLDQAAIEIVQRALIPHQRQVILVLLPASSQ